MADTSDYLTIRGAADRAKREGIPLSEYALRAMVRRNDVKYVTLGSTRSGKVLLYWPNILAYMQGNG